MSSGSDSDEDFVPGEPEQVSEEDSADEETELQYEKEVEHKTKKRKAIEEVKGKKKRRTRNGKPAKVEERVEEKEPEKETVLDPEEEKKREDDLWAKFLEGTETKPKPKETTSNVENKTILNTSTNNPAKEKKQSDDDIERERRIFEFAGETIVVENNVIKEKIKTAEAPVAALTSGPSQSRKSGGLSNVLGQLNKKNKLSTLEKSKLDWLTFKKQEGIEEEIDSHNKGKTGYLDRQDFLERTDHRQFEIERELRMSRRSNR